MTTDLQFQTINGWGVVTLNRPKALNALTHEMALSLQAKLDEWRGADHVKAILIEATEGKAFCAGGDIMALIESIKRGTDDAQQFFHDEYRGNATIATYPKPYLALINGIVMGGGVGISVHGTFRVATENTLFAMPETAIGLFPDVGASYFLPRLAKGLGLYLGLTGARLRGFATYETGIATHYVPSDQLPSLKSELLAVDLSDKPEAVIASLLDGFHQDGTSSDIIGHLPEIEAIFGRSDRLQDIVLALEKSNSPFAVDALKHLQSMAPLSLHVAFQASRKGAELNIIEALRMELRLATRMIMRPDFLEGVTAKLIERDREALWSPAQCDDVSKDMIEALFEDLGPQELNWPTSPTD